MSSNAGHRDYDENLLASAPVATKAQLQSGYNPDLLVEKPTPPPSRRDVERRGSSTPSSPVEQADHEPMPAKIPFYRTRKWIIIIAVVTLVVIGVAVGVGVGVSEKKDSLSVVQSVASSPPASTESPSPSGGIIAGASSQAGGADSPTFGPIPTTTPTSTPGDITPTTTLTTTPGGSPPTTNPVGTVTVLNQEAVETFR